jgi:hypothetical protein
LTSSSSSPVGPGSRMVSVMSYVRTSMGLLHRRNSQPSDGESSSGYAALGLPREVLGLGARPKNRLDALILRSPMTRSVSTEPLGPRAGAAWRTTGSSCKQRRRRCLQQRVIMRRAWQGSPRTFYGPAMNAE